MSGVEIRSEYPRRRPALRRLRTLAQKVLKRLRVQKSSLSVLLTTDTRIRKLNRAYLKHNRPTDVISFPGDRPFLGDIVISLDTVKRQAREYGHSFFYELAFCLTHGILHLIGYEDKTKRGFEAMDRKQKKILEAIGVKR